MLEDNILFDVIRIRHILKTNCNMSKALKKKNINSLIELDSNFTVSR